jgi:hypothetical protein
LEQAQVAADIQPRERVLLVGIGTGADLPLHPSGINVTGVKINKPVLEQSRKMVALPGNGFG